MPDSTSFALFGSGHQLVLIVLFGLGLVFVGGTRLWGMTYRNHIAAALGIFMVVQEFVDRGCRLAFNGEAWTQVLPLNLCGIGVFLVALMLLIRSYRIYEIMYFWALAGASMAILTPDTEYGYTHLLFWTFFLSHACLIYGVLLMTLCFQFRPTWGSLGRTILYTNLYALAVAPVNLLLESNYLFLREKPGGETAMNFMGAWPWYILVVEGIAVLLFVLLYLPYALSDIQARRRRVLQQVA